MPPPTEPFVAPVLRMEGGMGFHYLPIPPEIARPFLDARTRRVIATINGRPVDRGIQGGRSGDPHLIVGIALLRGIGVSLGDMVIVELEAHPDPNAVELGEEFEAALAMDDEASERFFAMTPGRRRGYAYYVTSAKRVETRIKRALEMAHKLRTNTLYGDVRREDD